MRGAQKLLVLAPEFARGQAHLARKESAEGSHVLVANAITDFRDTEVGAFQKLLGCVEATFLDPSSGLICSSSENLRDSVLGDRPKRLESTARLRACMFPFSSASSLSRNRCVCAEASSSGNSYGVCNRRVDTDMTASNPKSSL
jgi:hypothetical protein